MFKFKPNPTFTVAVPLSMPGVAAPQPVNMTFKHKNKTQLTTLFSKAGEQTDADLLSQILEGWDMNSDGAPVDLIAHNLGLLCDNYPAAPLEIIMAYKRELTEAKTKN